MVHPTRVVFELSPSGSGTRLRLRHLGEADERIARDLEGGWPTKVKHLADLGV